MAEIVTYGEGGYDPSKPNNNIVSVETVPDLPAADPAIDIAALKATVAKATTVPQLRGAMMAYLNAVAEQQQP